MSWASALGKSCSNTCPPQACHKSGCACVCVSVHCGLGAMGTKEQSAGPRSSQVIQISPVQLTSTGFTCRWIIKGLGLLRSWPKARGDGFAAHPPSCPRSWGSSKLCSLLGSSGDLAAKEEDFSFLLCLDVTAAFKATGEDPGCGQRGRICWMLISSRGKSCWGCPLVEQVL